MKYIKLFILSSLALLLGACGEELNNPTVMTPSHSVVRVSQVGNDNVININQHIDFADVSQGIESRQWIFPDSNVTVDGNPQDAQVRGTFHKEGKWEVTLSQVFQNNAFVGSETVARETNKIDTTFVVTVMPAVKLNSIKANLLLADGTLGDEIPMAPETPTEIPFGSILRFTYDATGSPSKIQGTLHGAELVAESPSNNTFDVKYVTLDKVYSFAPVFVRPKPYSADSLLVLDLVKCVRSDEPLLLENVTADADKKINLVYSRGLNANSVKASDYSVSITTAKGETLTPAVTGAYVNPANASYLVLEIGDELVYSNDVVKVTYTGNSLESQDAAIAPQFTNEMLVGSEEDLLKASDYDYSYENSAMTHKGADPAWLGNVVPEILEQSTEQKSDGNHSLKVSIPAATDSRAVMPSAIQTYLNGALHKFGFTENENNKLRLEFDIYIENNGGDRHPNATFDSNIRFHLSNKGSDWQEMAHGFAKAEEGKWLTFSNVIDVKNVIAEYNLIMKIVNTGSEPATLYIDNIRLKRYYPRP
ncbi:hypothetical protein HHU12_07565 [Flammeovirga aprica JL-4]|uniref:Uncharacterized protein n=2 Tax=Flammeovirga aprica TaxID=29528 RepID=A0A7X9RSY8_9BACT|nr:hypothetical protein [Flammeovirga aprica JL-4]